MALILGEHHVLRDSFPVPSHKPTSNSVHFFLGRSKLLKKLRESKIIKLVYSAPLPGPSNLCQSSTFALISSNLFFREHKTSLDLDRALWTHVCPSPKVTNHSPASGLYHSYTGFCIFTTCVSAYKHVIELFGMFVNFGEVALYWIHHSATCFFFFHSVLGFQSVFMLIYVVLDHTFSLLIWVLLYEFTTPYLPISFWRMRSLFSHFVLLETMLQLMFLIPIPLCESELSGRYLCVKLLDQVMSIGSFTQHGWAVFQSGCTNVHFDSST